MGELEGSAQSSGLVPNGLLPVDTAGVTRVLDAERWAEAEKRTAELIAQIQPTRPSEERRNAVANYVQRLIMKCFTCRVFTFGSVPLKTYLPDGDIDLTAMSENENLKDTWATKVRDILQSEERSANAEFHVKEVQYIQAEVKIIKCLVENIVVDISFNQVGGLCTLCFLDEIDHLISQSHLFKRSIILIKAWCYYESRILGAHHGLISTYALETLVLYIFHVFNNSFAGPLEVLYRFLEFFSNFDWDNFCVSLWGPLPISSLPDLTAEPPRKDSGELLLNEPFLRDCSTVYAVFPDGERQAQPFQSKHFNVIDPLRTNNNLGRSVSKGNFFRIRSAFSFGAKRLRRLLDSPKENLIAELNQFFKNTWERHGSGHRPDAPSLRQLHLMPRKNVPAEESQISRGNAAIKENSKYDESQVGHEHQSDGDHFERNSIQQSANTYRINYVFVAPRSPSLSHGSRMNSRDSDQFEIKSSSGGPVQPEEVQKSLPSDYCVSDHEGKGRFQFARTQSSPELTEASTEVLFRGTHSRAAETRVQHNVHTKSDNGNRGNNFNSDVSGGHSMRPFDDPSSLRRGSGHRSLVRIVDPDNLSSSYQNDTSSRAMVEDPTSGSLSLDMHQEAQDLVNMMASPRLQNFNGPVQLPMPLASTHLPIPLPTVLASTGYTQSNLAGHASANFSSVEPSWAQSMQFTHGFVSSPSQYFPTTGLNINHDDMVDSGNDSSGISDLKPLDVDPGSWHEHDAGSSTSEFDPDIAGFQMHHSEDMQPPDVFNYLPPSRGSNFGSSVMQIQHKFVRESRLPGRYDYTDAVHQTTRGNNINSNDRNTSLKFSPVSRASLRSQTSSGSSKDESGPKVFKPVREKWGTKATSSAVISSMHGTAKNGREFDCSSENVSGQEDGDSRGWIPLSTMKTDMAERVAGSASLPFTHARNHQEPSQIGEPGSMIPIPPFLVGSSRPRVVDNSGLVPFAFYPSGPPVPVLTMLPVYNLPSDAENYDRSGSQIDPGEREDQSHITLSDKSHVSVENYIPPEVLVSTSSSTDVAPELSVQPKSDILDSDFISHWKNLQFGRLCQNSHYHGQLIHPSPVMVSPMYLQGNFAWNGPGRPLSGNMITHVMGYGPQLVPVMPLQPGPNRSSGVFQRYGDDAPPRFRGGTGTFIPNTKANFRDRQFSNSRSQRGNYNYDRNEQSDRERSWISTKARASGRSHGRNQTEKPSSRLDRSVGAENRPYRVWDSYRRDPVTLHEVQNSSFGSSNLSHSSANMSNDMYPLPAVGSNGVSPTGHATPSVVMLYPYDQGVGYGSPAEQLEFGSVGPMHLSSMSETSRPNDRNPLRETYQQMHGMYPRDSPRTPPDQPSSPRVQRSTVEWNHELNEEDFPPVISNSRR